MLVISVCLAFVATTVLTYPVIAFARSKELYDSVGGRKIHTGKVPRLGGIAIFSGFVVSTIVILSVRGIPVSGQSASFSTLALGAVAIFGLGLFDDLKPIPARIKLVVQVLVAVAVAADGWRFRGFGITPDILASGPAWIPVILTALWIVGVTNAMNLIDGLDGLAGGLAAIASATFGVMLLETGSPVPALIAFALCGACLGFLVHNFPFPRRSARIFMGDSGSLFLGYALAVLPLAVSAPAPAAAAATAATKIIGLLVPFTVLAIPILDTLNAIRRRTKAHVSFATADRRHIHHILLGLGLSVWHILALLYSVAVILACAAMLSLRLPLWEGATLLVSGLTMLALIWMLVYYRHDASPLSFTPGEASRARKVIRK
ncbi:MAG: MraY family glycosyltransferase [Rectinemataceae bacterium]